MRDCTSGDSRVDLFEIFWGSVVVFVFSTSRLETRDLACEGEVGGEVEGDLRSQNGL